MSKFNKINFNHCKLLSSLFTNCTFTNVSFNNCDLSGSIFAFSHFFNTRIISSNLENLSFWAGKIYDSTIENCSLINTFLMEAKNLFNFKNCGEHHFTKPIILMPTHIAQAVNLRFAPFIKKSLHQEAALVLSVDVESKDIVNEALLRREVIESLQDIERSPPPNMLSRADELLKRAKTGSQLSHIKERAATLMEMSHGLVIPGGQDIEHEFYKPLSEAEDDRSSHNELNFARTLTELAFLQVAHERNIPTLGICRGSQLINVFFGGTLHDVEKQYGDQELTFTDSQFTKSVQQQLKYTTPFIGYSCHHQAAHILGQGLEVILKFKDVVKLLVHKSGSIIGSQFHPEQTLEEEAQGKDSSTLPQTGIYRFFTEKVTRVFKTSLAPAQGT